MELKLFKIPIVITFPFVALIFSILLCDKYGIVGFILLFAFLHETGHLSLMIITKSAPQKIILSAIGVSIVWDDALSQKKEFLIFSAGIIVNFTLSILFFIFNEKFFSAINLCMAIFNLLPIASFDGGRIFEIILMVLLKNRDLVNKIRKITSIIFLISISFLLMFTLKSKLFNFTAIITALYMLIVEISHIKY